MYKKTLILTVHAICSIKETFNIISVLDNVHAYLHFSELVFNSMCPYNIFC
jgi:hypothetical protein